MNYLFNNLSRNIFLNTTMITVIFLLKIHKRFLINWRLISKLISFKKYK